MRDDFSLLAINNALDELINNELQSITDKYNRPGRLINIDNLYIYQPLELDNENTSIYNKSTPVNRMIDSLTYEVSQPDMQDDDEGVKINKPVKNEETQKIKLLSGEKIVSDIVYYQTNIMSGNLNFVKNLENSKYNLLAYVMRFNNINNDNILNFDLELLPKIILHILIDNLDKESYITLFSYIYNTRDGFCSRQESQGVCLAIKDYLDESIVETEYKGSILKCLVIPSKSNYQIYSILVIKNENDGSISLTKGQQTDYTRLEDAIKSKYTIEPSSHPNAYAFIDVPDKIVEFYQFKIIYLKNDNGKYTKGKVCLYFSTMIDRYDSFMHNFLSQDEFNKLLNDPYKVGKYMCVIAELYFRYYNLIKKDNKTWFLSMNHALINKVIKSQ